MTSAAAGSPAMTRVAAWLRAGRSGMFLLALLVGAGAGLGAVVFRYLIYFFTWLATGHSEFGQAGYTGSAHLPWLGLGFFVVIPAIGGLLYGPLIYQWAREARGHGVPEVMIAVADNGGRIRPQVSVVKALASALTIGSGGSAGREGPIVQIGSALASSIGQWVRMPESRLRIMVACGAAGGISATFNAPVTGVFFGVEIILREFAVDALFTVMLSAMIADVIAIPFLGDKPFLSGFPAGIVLHPRTYLLVAGLAVVAALMGLAFKSVLYKAEDLCDHLWKGRPEWARPAVGGIALGLLPLALPQMYGVGYPVMYQTAAGGYAVWFPGPVTRRHDPQALFASESLSQALRQLEVYGRDGLPVLSPDGRYVEGWVTGASVLRALARQITGGQADTVQAQAAADWEHGDAQAMLAHPPARPAARLPVRRRPGQPAGPGATGLRPPAPGR